MATNISFSTYGFMNGILILSEENWRTFFKPFITDSVQSGLATIAGANMTVYVSAGECRCGAVMGILDEMIALDIADGDSTYNRIDSVIVQYTYGEPSTLAVAIVQGTPSANPVPPTLTKVYDTLWQMEIAQILVPSGATSSSELTITDKRVIYESIESIIDDNTESEERVWSSQKTREEIVSFSSEIYDSLNTKADAITRTASGDIVTITDGGDNLPVKELVVGIEPVQDLHGYDYPWVGGGGVNLCPETVKVVVNSSGFYRDDVNGTHWGCVDHIPCSEGEKIYCTIFDANAGSSTNISVMVYTSDDTYIDGGTIQSGNTYFTAPANSAYYIFRTSATIEASGNNVKLASAKGTAITSWSPYSNVCPISGHTQAVVTRTGKNLWSNDYFATESNPMTLITDPTDPDYGYYNGKMSSWNQNYNFVNDPNNKGYFGTPLDLGRVTVSLVGKTKTGENNVNIKFWFLYDDGSTSNSPNITLTSTSERYSYTSTSGKNCTKVLIASTAGANDTRPCIKDVQIELGDTMTAYEEPTRQQVTIDLDGTRYGGVLDVLTGTMRVDRVSVTFDGSSDEEWEASTYYRFLSGSIPYSAYYERTAGRYLISDTLKPIAASGPGASTQYRCFIASSTKIGLQLSSEVDTTAKLRTWLASNPVQIVYYLAEPQTVPLTQSQMQTLLGQNAIWADTGNILNLTYLADSKSFIDEQIAESQIKTRQMMTVVTDKMIAPNNLNINDIIVVNDELYKVINSNIASGEAMVIGTNVIKITLAEYIQSLI